MADMLVNLYKVPEYDKERMDKNGVKIKRVLPCDKAAVKEFITTEFGAGWADEAEKAILQTPASTCFIAVKNSKIVGFTCYNAIAPGYYGPLGVAASERGTGVGLALCFYCLTAMRWNGYGYAIFNAGPTEYYEKKLGAIKINDSDYDAVYENLICAEEGKAEEEKEKNK